MKISSFLMITLAVASQHVFAQSKPFSIQSTFHIKSGGGWDYLSISPANNSLYVSHGTQVNILDKTTGDSLGVISNTTGVHGIAFAAPFEKGFTSNGKLNTVTVFDLKTNVPTATIPTGESPDAMVFDPFTKKLFIANGHSKSVTIVDAATNNVLETVDLDGKPETIVTDEKGKIFINLEDKSEIVVLNSVYDKITDRWSLSKGEEPTGLAIDLKNNRLFVGCGNKLMLVVNASNGTLIAALPIGDECDGVAFDPETRNIFAPAGDGTLTIIHQQSADGYKVIQTLKTLKGARTITVDCATHKVYLPAADFNPQTAEEKATHKRAQMIPGTFRVLVVGQK